MSDKTDYYLSHRFDADRNYFQFSKEKDENGEEIIYASKRFGLLKDDVSDGMQPITAERIRELVKSFKEKSLAADDIAFNNLKIASRNVLYHQLAEAYAFGLACFSSIYNEQYLSDVLTEYGLSQHAWKIIHKGRYNKWNAITALLYGEWQSVSENEVDGLTYKRDRSAEKYGCVLAMLEFQKVKVNDAADFISKYVVTHKPTGEKLRGIVALEKHYRDKVRLSKKTKGSGPSQRQIDRRQRLITRGENPMLNDDVFEMPKPTQLPDAFEFGRVVVKRVGDEKSGYKLLVVGYETWELAQYQKHAFSRGKSADNKEKAEQAKQDARNKQTEEERNAIAANLQYDEAVSELIAGGMSAEDITMALKETLKNMKSAQNGATHIDELFDADPS